MKRLIALALIALSAGAQAAYPEKPIRFILPSAAGGSVDVLMRVLAQQLSAQMGVGFVVENKPGGAFVPGTMDIVRAAPDGYTLGYGNIVSLAINRSLLEKVPYDVEKDLTLVSNCVQVFNMLAVNNDLPVRSVQELVAYAKKNPGKLTNGSSGNGTTGHLGGELFKSMTGVDMTHVPYRGSTPAVTDMIGGQVQVMFDVTPTALPQIKAGKLRALGATTAKRLDALPDLPTIGETVKGYKASAWIGVGAPKGTPPEIIATLNKQISAAVSDATIQKRLTDLGATPMPQMTPAEFGKMMADDYAKWSKVIKSANIKPQ